MDILTAEDSDCIAILEINGDVLRGPGALPAFLKLLVEHVVLFQVTRKLQCAIWYHHTESTLKVFGSCCSIELVQEPDELGSNVLLVGVGKSFWPKLNSFSLTVISIVDLDNATACFVDH